MSAPRSFAALKLASAIAVVSAIGTAASAECPDTGDAKSLRVQQLNVLKNRAEIPAHINPAITLAAMIEPGDDHARFSTADAATVTGYVVNVMVGGVETANCKARGISRRDTHLELALEPTDRRDPTRHVIVEITPRLRDLMKSKGVDWSTDAVGEAYLNREVRVTGWMFFDAEHAHDSAHTAHWSMGVWRATAWEIHPVTDIELMK